MTSHPIIIPIEIEEAIHLMAARGDGAEDMIARMRAMGLPKPHSMALLRNAMHVGLGEAKKMVHFSPTWNDRRVADEEFHEALYQAAVEAGYVEDASLELRSVA